MAQEVARDRAADRARGRRRLLDVLLEARARGAGRRAQRAGGARGSCGDVGPLGAHLRPDGDRRDGRHVPHRRRDVRVVRRRDDRRRRDRDARLAHRAAGAAVEARRQGRPRTRAVPPAGSGARAARAGSGARSSTASCGGPSCRRSSRAGCWWRSPLPALAAAHGHAGRGHVPAVASRREDLRPDAAGVPGHGAAGERRRQGAERERARGARGDRAGSSSARSRAAGCTSRSRSTSTGTRPSRTSRSRSTGPGPTASPSPASSLLREQIVPETVGGIANAEAGVTGARRPVDGRHRADEVDAAVRGRVRARVRVRADAVRLPLDRGRGQGDRAQPAVGRRGLRRARDRVPARRRRRGCSASAPPPGSTRSCRCCSS